MTSVADFGAKTEARDVIAAFPDSVRDKISKFCNRLILSTTGLKCGGKVLITGVGPNGLGGTLAQALAAENPRLLILAGRTAAKVESVAEAIATGDSGVETRILLMDLSSFDSVRKAVRAVLAYQEQRIDIVVNNAGIMNVPERRLSSDGFELHLATNYLGTFLFTIGILDKLLGSGSGRIVNVGSNGYIFSPFRFADYNFDGKLLPDNEIPPRELCEQYGLPWSMDYTPTVAYGQSRTALVLFTVQLNRLFNERGISAVCVHPGGEIYSHTVGNPSCSITD